MLLRRIAASFALAGFLGSVAAAQDVVHLKNRKVLSGTIVFDGDSKAGFTLRRWDTGGEVFIKWSQVSDAEAYRIRTRAANPEGVEAGSEEMIDVVRIVTNTDRELVGVIQSEKDGMILIKTLEGVQTTAKTAEVLRENQKVREGQVYTPEERVDRKAKGVADSDFQKLQELGDYASSLKVFARARDFYQRAEKAAPDGKKEELAAMASSMGLRIVEDNAEKALAAARKLATELEWENAIAAAQKFLADFAETSVAKANAALVSEIEARRKEYIAGRDKFLARDIPEQWAKTRTTLLAKYSGSKFDLQKAREAVGKLDDEIIAEVGKKLKATNEEVTRHWAARTEKKFKSVSMKDGTWLHRGGQDGGMDYSGDGDDGIDDFNRRFGDGQDPKKKKQQLGRKLETQNEWWQNAQSGKRREWLECFYADTSPNVTKEVIEKDCKDCKGEGKRNEGRGGKTVEVICHECHGVKKELTIKFW
jgi:hypothetical protein